MNEKWQFNEISFMYEMPPNKSYVIKPSYFNATIAHKKRAMNSSVFTI
jgi:hypothetical protein